MPESPLKRKKPPTFQNLPFNRAKKLKQTWVANAKIKSKWKAQKRKEGASLELKELKGSQREEFDVEKPDVASELEKEEQGPEEKPVPSQAATQADGSLENTRKRQREGYEINASAHPGPSLRDLTREAYSRSSLHTFKAGHGQRDSRGRGRGTSRGITGRGQPNMKLRMNVMLEKIIHDLP